jgi:hypothetical protein
MSRAMKTILFGIASGLIWSILGGGLNAGSESVCVFTAGTITGVIVSLVLKKFLVNSKWRKTTVLGLLSLPLGAFVFGTLLTIFTETIQGPSDAVYIGAYYAFMSVLVGFCYFPLSVCTTFLLRRIIYPDHKASA